MWFKIDDGFAFHPKAMAAGRSLHVWVRAGSWCGFHLTDGRLPRGVLTALGGTEEDAAALVAAGLWEPTETGWRFHDWLDYNPTRDSVLAEREKARQRMAKLRAPKTGAQPSAAPAPGVTDLTAARDARGRVRANTTGGYPARSSGPVRANIESTSPDVTATFADPDPTRSPPSEGGARERAQARASATASARCDAHRDVQDPPPCRRCAEAREALTAQQADEDRRRRAANERGWCAVHPDQRAAGCYRCVADAAPADANTRGAALARAAHRRPEIRHDPLPVLPASEPRRLAQRLIEHQDEAELAQAGAR